MSGNNKAAQTLLFSDFVVHLHVISGFQAQWGVVVKWLCCISEFAFVIFILLSLVRL